MPYNPQLDDAIKARLVIERVESLSDSELDRAFENCVAPDYCKRHALYLINHKGLTFETLTL